MQSIYHVNSEVGELEAVLLHRPGKELERLTPQYLEELLFEDIPWLGRIREEHDLFARALEERGARVFYYDRLLTDILKQPDVRKRLIEEVLSFSGLDRLKEREAIGEHLEYRTPGELSEILIAGLHKNEIDYREDRRSLSYYITDDYPFYINPLPNLYFTRDPGAVIGEGLSVNVMKTAARNRETMLLSYINRYHPEIGGEGDGTNDRTEWYGYDRPDPLEGGDMLVLNSKTVALGCSARTSATAIESLAESLFQGTRTGRGTVEEVIVIQIPFKRAYMHLDTVFTMVDRDKFIIFPGVQEALKVFSLKPGSRSALKIRPCESLESALTHSLGVPSVRLIQSGGGDRITAAREQWNDSTNTLAVAPGQVVTYRRNRASNDTLRENGVDVIEIEGSELVRGRGGPRCMSMPLRRRD